MKKRSFGARLTTPDFGAKFKRICDSLANLAAVLPLLIFAVGCNLSDYVQTTPPQNNGNRAVVTKTNGNKSTVETVTETVLNTEKTGIPECDDAVALVEQQIQNDPEQTLTERLAREAVKRYVFYQVRENIGKATEQQKADYAKQCKLLTDNLNTIQ